MISCYAVINNRSEKIIRININKIKHSCIDIHQIGYYTMGFKTFQS